MVKSIQGILTEAGRQISGETMTWIGQNPISIGALQLMLRVIGHPVALTFCSRGLSQLDCKKVESIIREEEYQGNFNMVNASVTLPESCYDSSLIVGITSWKNAIDIKRLATGSLLVDYSFPHISSLDDACVEWSRITISYFILGPHCNSQIQYGKPFICPKPLRHY
ncbi:MAG: hypothetical protein GKR95_08900 [Gammaproteobacteria bacterium]|nr:hypothetical protein [Gammaproteobacteria bacterium]